MNANQFKILDIKFDKPFVAYKAIRGVEIYDYAVEGNRLYVLYWMKPLSGSSVLMHCYEYENDTFVSVWEQFPIGCFSVLGANFQIQNNQILIIGDFNSVNGSSGQHRYEIILNKNTGQIESTVMNDSLAFAVTPFLKNTIGIQTEKTFSQMNIDPYLLVADNILSKRFLILKLPTDSLCQLPPYSYINSVNAEHIILVTYSSNINESLLFHSLQGVGIRKGTSSDFEYEIQTKELIKVNSSVYTDKNFHDYYVELSKDSTFGKESKQIELTKDFNFYLKNSIETGNYFLRLGAKTNNKNLHSQYFKANILNDNYQEFKSKKIFWWFNIFTIITLVLVLVFVSCLAFVPALMNYKYNFLSSILNSQIGGIFGRIVWFIIFSLGVIKLFPALWKYSKELNHFLNS